MDSFHIYSWRRLFQKKPICFDYIGTYCSYHYSSSNNKGNRTLNLYRQHKYQIYLDLINTVDSFELLSFLQAFLQNTGDKQQVDKPLICCLEFYNNAKITTKQ